MSNQLNRCTSGFTLLEVLVAALILAVGLLGVAGMQIAGLRYSQSAYLRSQATLAANDIIDRMRANRDGVEAGVYSAVDSSATLPSDPGCLNTANGCTPAQLATHDILEWAAHFRNVSGAADYVATLPAGQGTVTRDAADVTLYTVTVSWEEQDSAETGGRATKQLSMNVRLL